MALFPANPGCRAQERSVRRVVGLLGVLVLVLAVRLACPYRLLRVDGNSMTPTFHSGQLLLVDVREPRQAGVRRGDVVLFRWQGRSYIKRVYAVGGETVWKLTSARGADAVLAGEQRDWALRQCRRFPAAGSLVTVPVKHGELFFLGDALTNSIDSRDFGPVPLACVRGRVVAPVADLWPTVVASRSPSSGPLLATVAKARR